VTAARCATARRLSTAGLAVLVLALAACGGDSPDADGAAASPTPSVATLSGTLTVLAAASLQETFTALERELETQQPSVDVVLAFGASSTLAEQLIQGAPGDVLATASPATMDQAVQAGAAGEPVVFASNEIAIAVPKANPAGIDDVADLTADGVKLAMCEPQVPCGAVGQQLLDAAGLDVEPVTLEPDVRAVLTKVRLDEVDAGLVYATDVQAAADEVTAVPLPEDLRVATDYPVAIAAGASQPELAQAFVDLLTGPEGQRILEAAGFTVP
jgi:molybdate transport system substrate-binding protein